MKCPSLLRIVPLLTSLGSTLSLLTCPVARSAPLCQSEPVAVLSLQNTDYTISTMGQMEGHALSFLVDTGSEGSLLTAEARSHFSLRPDPFLKATISGPDGKGHIVPSIMITRLKLGNLQLTHTIFPIGDLPGAPLIDPPLWGLIGMDILGHYDLDFDLPHNRLTLWRIQTDSLLCTRPPHWPQNSTHKTETLPAKRIKGRFIISFTLDGHTGTALVDSGARSHILSLSFAHKMGLTDNLLAQDPGGYSAGIDSQERRYQWHRFHQLRLGGTVTKNPILTIAPMTGEADMLLGADWFTAHHIWISGATRQIYVSH